MMRTSLVQSLQRLIDNFHFRLCSLGSQQFHHLARDFLIGERSIDILHIVYHLLFRQSHLIFRFTVGSRNHIFHIPLL